MFAYFSMGIADVVEVGMLPIDVETLIGPYVADC